MNRVHAGLRGIRKEQIVAVLLGVVIAYAITAIAFIATALALTYTGLGEGALPLVVILTCVVSVMVAGFDAARKAEHRGWVWGMAAGGLYALVLVCIIMWVNGGFVADVRKIILLALSVLGGGAGGVIGINFRKK